MIKTYANLPGWKFEIHEVSAGVYEVVARDASGRLVQGKGLDVYDVLEKCKTEAAAFLKRA
jgi:hypothetical protein